MKVGSTRKAVLNTSAIFLMIIAAMIYLYLKDPSRNYLYYQAEEYKDVIVAKSDITQGDVLSESNAELIKVKNTELLNNNEIYASSLEELVGKKALYPLKRGQVLPRYYFLEKEKWYEGKHQYAIEVDIPSTVANSIKVGDYIDINVSYDPGLTLEELYKKKTYENLDIVISKVMVEDIKNAESISYGDYINGNPASSFVPRYVKVNIDYNQIDDYLGAKAKGDIFLIKYDDITAEPNIKTYRGNTNAKPIVPNIDNISTEDGTQDGGN